MIDCTLNVDDIQLFDTVILVRLDPPKEKIGNIIVLPDMQGNLRFGTIVRTGPGLMTQDGELIPMPCKSGDRVYCRSYADPHVPGDSPMVFLRPDDILCYWRAGVQATQPLVATPSKKLIHLN